jgi:hypothetical protein
MAFRNVESTSRIPEVVTEEPRRPSVDPVIEYLEWLTERVIRIGPWSFGLDGILGLIPGLGDVAGGIVSAFIVARAARAGIPRAAVARMMANVAIDSVLGAIPIAGDLFDFLYKANTRNLEIYRQSLMGRRQPRRDWGFVILFVLGVALLLAVPITVAVMVIRSISGG